MKQKCPDRQLLSVYFDGEMPSPWKEKMEAHVAGCSCCAEKLNAYQCISIKPVEGKGIAAPETVAAAQERLWKKIESRTVISPVNTIWRRRISIPIPAAAAIFLLVAFAFLAAFRTTDRQEIPNMIIASENSFDTPGIIPAADIGDVLQYLASRDDSELIILRLPESRNFVSYGEPAMIRAADYSRTMPGWGKH